MENYEILWNKAVEILKQKLSHIAFSTHIEKIKAVDLVGRKIVLNVPSEITANAISNRFLDKILDALDIAETGVNAVKLTVGNSEKDFLSGEGEESASILEESMEI